MSVASYPILQLKPRTIFIFLWSSFFFMFSYIFNEYANEIICKFIIVSTSYISTLFGTTFGSPGYKAAEI